MIVVHRPGLLTTLQDLGRPGLAHLGVPGAGAADVEGLRHANALVGNRPGAAALEVTALGPDLLFQADATVAVHGRARFLPTGTVLSVGPVPGGLRGYVAVRGGIDVAPVLGSRSTCTLSGLGPASCRPRGPRRARCGCCSDRARTRSPRRADAPCWRRSGR